MSWSVVALPIVLALPLAGCLLLAGLPRVSDRAAAAVGTAVSAGVLGLILAVAAGFDYGASRRAQFVFDRRWIPAIDVRFHLGVDGISLPLLLLTALLVFLCCVSCLGYVPSPGRARTFVALILLLEVGVLSTFMSLDLLLFFVAFETVLIPMYFLIAVWGGAGRRHAAMKFVLYTLLGSAFMLLGLLTLGFAAGSFNMGALAARHGVGIARITQDLAFLTLALGFAIKSPLWPLHTWLPDAHTEAPTVGSVLLAGVLLKMGTYGFIRIGLPELPLGARDAAPALGVLAAVAIVYGSLCCLAQTDLKRLIAYSSVGHMGFVLLGIATLSPVGIDAALYGNIAHGVITGLLFFLVGGVKDRYGTANIGDIGGGFMARAPYLASLLTLGAVASLGLPGLAGFWGELFALLGAYNPGGGLSVPLFRSLLALGLLGTLLTAGYFLWMLRRVTLGIVPSRWRAERSRDVAEIDLLAWTPLVVLTVALGLYPRLVLGITHDAVRALVGG